tara:strand:- start:760 stop:1149 length:390 start_codon:yes stop_codon:yes gene_type:complete
MSVLSFISGLFKPAVSLIDELHVSEEEKGKLRNELAQIQSQAQKHLLDYEGKVVEARSKLLVSESSSKFWLTSAWRPLMSMLLILCIVLASYGIGNPDERIYELAKVLLGIYAGSRSCEKIIKVSKFGK